MTLMIPTTPEEVHQRATAAAEREAESWRKALEGCTPKQVEEFAGNVMTAEELIHEKRMEEYSRALWALTESCNARGGCFEDHSRYGFVAARMLRDLGYVTDQPLHYAVIALLKATENAGATDPRANVLDVLNALGSVYGARRVNGAAEAFRLHAALNNREEI